MGDAARKLDENRLRRALVKVLNPSLVARLFDEATVDTEASGPEPTKEAVEAEIARFEKRRRLKGR
jgi:hypothetical protein